MTADGSAHASGRIRVGDVVVATSGSIGDSLWKKSSLEQFGDLRPVDQIAPSSGNGKTQKC